ncbi:MAG: DUF3347 domain-containing protein [Thermodesulfobacteriota bacterium]
MKQKRIGFKTLCIMIVVAAWTGIAYSGSEKFDDAMQPILMEYLKITDALASDKSDPVPDAAKKIEGLAQTLSSSMITGEHAGHYKNIPKNLLESSKKMTQAKDIAKMRSALSELSKPMAMWASMSKPAGINVVYCPMYPGSWLQKGAAVRNPYYGAKMSRCGDIISGPDAKK